MTRTRNWLIHHFYPGTIEEFYAAREIQRREKKICNRQIQFIVGIIAIGVPMFVLIRSDILPISYKVLCGVAIWGIACIREAITEHYSLQLLRRERAEQNKKT